MNKELIRNMAIRGGIYDCLCDPYDKLKNGDDYSSILPDLERFAEKLIKECVSLVEHPDYGSMHDFVIIDICNRIKEHFGVE